MTYYNRQGAPIPTEMFSRLFEDANYQRVAIDEVNGVTVSTVWLGIDHGFGLEKKPVIFETMAFDSDGEELSCERYSTEEKAVAGHKRFVRQYKKLSPKED